MGFKPRLARIGTKHVSTEPVYPFEEYTRLEGNNLTLNMFIFTLRSFCDVFLQL